MIELEAAEEDNSINQQLSYFHGNFFRISAKFLERRNGRHLHFCQQN